MSSNKAIANKGVARNKKPLKNKLYKIEVKTVDEFRSSFNTDKYKQYLFKDEGYLILNWKYESKHIDIWSWHGFITPDELKTLLNSIGKDQWAKFCQGKREFVEQRRVDGKNIAKIK